MEILKAIILFVFILMAFTDASESESQVEDKYPDDNNSPSSSTSSYKTSITERPTQPSDSEKPSDEEKSSNLSENENEKFQGEREKSVLQSENNWQGEWYYASQTADWTDVATNQSKEESNSGNQIRPGSTRTLNANAQSYYTSNPDTKNEHPTNQWNEKSNSRNSKEPNSNVKLNPNAPTYYKSNRNFQSENENPSNQWKEESNSGNWKTSGPTGTLNPNAPTYMSKQFSQPKNDNPTNASSVKQISVTPNIRTYEATSSGTNAATNTPQAPYPGAYPSQDQGLPGYATHGYANLPRQYAALGRTQDKNRISSFPRATNKQNVPHSQNVQGPWRSTRPNYQQHAQHDKWRYNEQTDESQGKQKSNANKSILTMETNRCKNIEAQFRRMINRKKKIEMEEPHAENLPDIQRRKMKMEREEYHAINFLANYAKQVLTLARCGQDCQQKIFPKSFKVMYTPLNAPLILIHIHGAVYVKYKDVVSYAKPDHLPKTVYLNGETSFTVPDPQNGKQLKGIVGVWIENDQDVIFTDENGELMMKTVLCKENS